MKVNLYAIFDSASCVYDGPAPAHNDGVALRDFDNIARNPETKVGMNPEYFSLWRVGTWDDSKGEPSNENKECLAYAHELIAPPKEETN